MEYVIGFVIVILVLLAWQARGDSEEDEIRAIVEKLNMDEIEERKYRSQVKRINMSEKFKKLYPNLKAEEGSDEGMYYVYEYSIKDKVIYVGKGSHGGSSCKYFRACHIDNHKYCKPYRKDIEISIVKTFDDKNKALKYESAKIAEYGIENLLNKKG